MSVPYYLLITRENSSYIKINVEEPEWMKTHAAWMRGASRWYMVTIDTDEVKLVVDVADGDQPYYAARHLNVVRGPNVGRHVLAYGIGAKRVGGQTDRMWLMPDGTVCVGNDVDILLDAYVKRQARDPLTDIGGKE